MANAASVSKKKIVAVAAVAVAVVALIAVVAYGTAYGFWYVHDETLQEEDNDGAIEVCVTIDETAIGNGTRAGLIYLPEGSTAADVLTEAVVTSECFATIDDLHNYDVTTLGDDLADYTYTIDVYSVDDQEPGTHTTHDGESLGGEDTVLERYNTVYITVTE